MLAPGGLKETPLVLVRQDGTTWPDRVAEGQDLTLNQAMMRGKWKLVAWLDARAKAADLRRFTVHP